MTTEPDSLFDPRDGAASRSEEWSNDPDIAAIEYEVRMALEHRSLTGTTELIADRLDNGSARSARFWVEAALELHSKGEHYDALDCWKRATAVENSEYLVDRELMSNELWHASRFGDDEYLAAETAATQEDAGNWQAALHIRLKLQGSDQIDPVRPVLAAIRARLESGKEVVWSEDWPIETNSPLDFEDIDSMEALEAYEELVDEWEADLLNPTQIPVGLEQPEPPRDDSSLPLEQMLAQGVRLADSTRQAVVVKITNGKRVFQLRQAKQ